MTARNMKAEVRLTEMELRAAHTALSNYTPGHGECWKQGAQARAIRIWIVRITGSS
jgi:hypothetical protein